MGLDVTAYRGLKAIDCVFDADGELIDPQTREPLENCLQLGYQHSDHAERSADIDLAAVYSYDKAMDGPSLGYGRYSNWRNQLAELAGYTPLPDEERGGSELRHDMGAWMSDGGPFWELIHFSDCEGTLGTAVCQKLAKDFKDFEDKASTFLDETFLSRYQEFHKLFDFASDNGVVKFH